MSNVRTTLIGGALFALVWAALARGGPGWLAAGAVGVAAAWATLRVTAAPPQARLCWRRLPRFLAFFVGHSLAGGLDVARRVLAPDMRLQPGLVTIRTALPTEGARVLLALAVSLMPGTLAARVNGDELTLHALDAQAAVEEETRRIEREIAALFEAEHR